MSTSTIRHTLDDLTLIPASRTAVRANRVITLTRTEFVLLSCLVTNAGRTVSRPEILRDVWGQHSVAFATTSLAVYIGYLRRKTEKAGEPRLIHTVRGVGYQARSASWQCLQHVDT